MIVLALQLQRRNIVSHDPNIDILGKAVAQLLMANASSPVKMMTEPEKKIVLVDCVYCQFLLSTIYLCSK
jgi:hypothetical protein